MNTSKRFSLSRYALSAILTLIPVCVFAGNNSMIAMQDSIQKTDSIDKVAVTDLKEYVVQGRNAFYKNGILTVIPTEREKSYASDGNELLRFLQIPQLIYDFRERKISHLGGNLAMYINGVAATDADIRNLKTTDVQKVEYMDFPQDPRYGFNAHVINFIVQKYIYGGYTRLNTTESLTFFANMSSLYSKFNINDVTIDVNAEYWGNKMPSFKDDKESTYLFKDSSGNPIQLTEKQSLVDSYSSENRVPVTLRVQIVKPRYIISNTIGYTFNGVPKSTDIYDTEYSGLYSEITRSETRQKYSSNSISWKGSYIFFLPRKWFLSVSPQFEYGHYNNLQTSNSGIMNLEDVSFKTRENNYSLGINGFLTKPFSSGHKLQAGANVYDKNYKIDYLGTSSSNVKLKILSMQYSLGYSYNNRSGLSLGIVGGLAYNRSSSNGIVNSEMCPNINGYLQYNPNSKHSMYLTASYRNIFTEAGVINPDVIQVNNFMYLAGNPNIGNVKNFSGRLMWNWIPTNLLRIGITASYDGNYNNQETIYMPYNNGTGILRTYVNNGSQHMYMGNLTLSFNNIAKFLSITLRPNVTVYNETGYYARTLTELTTQIQLDCFLKNGINLFASYYTPQKRYYSGVTSKLNHSYEIGGNWHHKNLHISLTLSDLFVKKWGYMENFATDCYSYATKTTNCSDRGNIYFSISYLFSYGKKKIEQDDEINGLSGPGSGAISF